MTSSDHRRHLAQQLTDNELLWEILQEIEDIAVQEWRASVGPDMVEEREASHAKVSVLNEIRQTIRNSLTKRLG